MSVEAIGVGTLVPWMASEFYCIDMIPLGESVSVVPGTVLEIGGAVGGAGLITNGNEADADAIALTTAASTGVGNNPLIPALVRGPALVNGDRLVRQTSVEIAELIAPLAAIGVKVIREPANPVTL